MNNLNVGMGEIKIATNSSDVLVAPGLGSCIGLVIYDEKTKIAGMAHVVLPDSTSINKEVTQPGKYADTAVPALVEQLTKQGASMRNLIAFMSGGSQMFSFDSSTNVFNIGTRNAIAVKNSLKNMNIVLKYTDTGGNTGRTVKFDMSKFIFTIKCIGKDEKVIGVK